MSKAKSGASKKGGASIHGNVICCPVIYGSYAYHLGKKVPGGPSYGADGAATHRWTLFIRGANNEDLSTFVSKVAFSFITEAPFEVTEVGWGEFGAKIRVFFRDPAELPVDFTHLIRLHATGAQSANAQPNTKKPVVSEQYDEIVFKDPNEPFRQLLLTFNMDNVLPAVDLPEYKRPFDEDKDLLTLSIAQQHINRELDIAKARFLEIESRIRMNGGTST
jgi:YEATS domain-containing protein 4